MSDLELSKILNGVVTQKRIIGINFLSESFGVLCIPPLREMLGRGRPFTMQELTITDCNVSV